MAIRPAMKRNKFGAVPTVVDGIRFHSKAEAKRWIHLQWLVKARVIRDLRRQVTFYFPVNGETIAEKYIADFVYVEAATGERIVEDVKGVKTDLYKIKRSLMRACHGIRIREVA